MLCSGKAFPIKALGVELRIQLVLVVYDRKDAARWGPLRSYINSIGYECFFRHCEAAPPLPHMGSVTGRRCSDARFGSGMIMRIVIRGS